MQKKVMIESSNHYCDICYINGTEKMSNYRQCYICKKDICHEHSKSHDGLREKPEFDDYYQAIQKGSTKKYCPSCFKHFEKLGKEIEKLNKKIEEKNLEIYKKERELKREK